MLISLQSIERKYTDASTRDALQRLKDGVRNIQSLLSPCLMLQFYTNRHADNIKRHFESSGHCTGLLSDRKAQKRYKQDAEGIAKADAAKAGQHAGHTSAAPAQDDQE